MKKHILGLMLFSIIVSVAAIGYAIFNVNEISQVVVSQDVPTKGVCAGTELIQQPSLNTARNILFFTVNCPESQKAMLLYFYGVSEKNTRLVAIQKTDSSDFSVRWGGKTFYKKIDWVEKINLKENLYVIPHCVGEDFSPEFNKSHAIPVLFSPASVDFGW